MQKLSLSLLFVLCLVCFGSCGRSQACKKTEGGIVVSSKVNTNTTDSSQKTVQSKTKNSSELSQIVIEASKIAKSHKPLSVAVGTKSKNASDASGFLLVTDVIADAIVETRYYSSYNFVGTRVDGYQQPVAIATREAVIALKGVADDLRSMGYLLKIFDAYRPQMAVNHFCRWAKNSDEKMKSVFYPHKQKKELFPTYIALKSGHSKGSTFDLTMVDSSTIQDVDMGGIFDYFGELSHYSYSKITSQQASNRKLLHDVMLKHGFKAYSNEWWHFTLKNEPYPNTYFTFPNNSKLIK